MAAFQSKIMDLVRSLVVSLQLSMLLPATILVFATVWLVAPDAFATDGDTMSTTLLIAIVVMISYLLHAFNMVIIRGLEGYILAGSPPLRVLRDLQIDEFVKRHQRISDYRQRICKINKVENDWLFANPSDSQKTSPLEGWRRGWESKVWHERERLEERFPPTPDMILATEFGNTIRAFESYPARRYEIGLALWPRFVPTLVRKKVTAQPDDATYG